MTAATLRTEPPPRHDAHLPIDCGCGQLLAWRRTDGTIQPECRDAVTRPDGRVVLPCPRCGEVTRARPGYRTPYVV
jgi:hypothetical protein